MLKMMKGMLHSNCLSYKRKGGNLKAILYVCIYVLLLVGYLGEGHALVPRDARRLELSVWYHTRTGHFRTPFFLSPYHHHLIVACNIHCSPSKSS